MASNSSVPAVLNPNTPLAFLPPTFADQFQVSCYVCVAGLSAFVWDWLMCLAEEYKIFRKTRFSVPDIAYALSRIGTLGYSVSAIVFQVAPVVHCHALLYIIGSFVVLSMSSNSLLFFFRVRAVYGNSTIITGFFGFLWVATSGLYVLNPFALFGEHIGPTNRCILTSVRSYVSVPVFLNAINDTLIFLAISYHIISYTIIGDSWSARAKSFFRADGLPKLSKGLLQGGQLYYFATIGLSIVTCATLLAPNIPPVYHPILFLPNIVLENAMACRVYRAVKLGFIKNPQNTSFFGSTIRSHSTPGESGRELAFKRPTSVESSKMPVTLDLTRTTDSEIQDYYATGKRVPLVDGVLDACDRV